VPSPDTTPKGKTSEDAVLDFLANLLADPDFSREIEPIRHKLMYMQMARMTPDQVRRVDQEIATQWKEKAGPVFWARVATSGMDIEAVQSFLKAFADSPYDRQGVIVRQIVERMPQEQRPGACNMLVLGFLYQQISRDRAFEIHLQDGFDGKAVTITVDGATAYTGRPKTNNLLGIAEVIKAKAATRSPIIGLASPDMGIKWSMQVDLDKGQAVGLSARGGSVVMRQAKGFGYD
jgi:hypothetical protein